MALTKPQVEMLPTGTVLQVVNATYSTTVTTTSTSFVDTGLTATITPKSATSKILILIGQPYQSYVTSGNARDDGLSFQIACNGSSIWNQASAIGIYLDLGVSATFSINQYGQLALSVLHSPATTSATTYKLQFSAQSGRTALLNTSGGSSGPATITLMEIAA